MEEELDDRQSVSNVIQIGRLVLNCNKIAMDYLRQGKSDKCYHLINKAKTLLLKETSITDYSAKQKLIALTLNNLGCYYKKKNKPNVALNYMKQALQIEIGIKKDEGNLASTHLNICAILSQLGRHDKALEHSEQAVKYIDLAIQKTQNTTGKIEKNLLVTQIISFYNLGVEKEFLGMEEESLRIYKHAIKLARQNIGVDNPFTKQMCENVKNLLEKLEQKENLHLRRQLQRNERGTKQLYNDSLHIQEIGSVLRTRRRNNTQTQLSSRIRKSQQESDTPKLRSARRNLTELIGSRSLDRSSKLISQNKKMSQTTSTFLPDRICKGKQDLIPLYPREESKRTHVILAQSADPKKWNSLNSRKQTVNSVLSDEMFPIPEIINIRSNLRHKKKNSQQLNELMNNSFIPSSSKYFHLDSAQGTLRINNYPNDKVVSPRLKQQLIKIQDTNDKRKLSGHHYDSLQRVTIQLRNLKGIMNEYDAVINKHASAIPHSQH